MAANGRLLQTVVAPGRLARDDDRGASLGLKAEGERENRPSAIPG